MAYNNVAKSAAQTPLVARNHGFLDSAIPTGRGRPLFMNTSSQDEGKDNNNKNKPIPNDGEVKQNRPANPSSGNVNKYMPNKKDIQAPQAPFSKED